MSTTRNLLTSALRVLGVVQSGQPPYAPDIDVAREALVSLLDSWSTDRLLVFATKPSYFPVQGSKQTYSIGPTGEFVTPRPVRIEYASFIPDASLVLGVYTPSKTHLNLRMELLNTQEFSAIQMKNFDGGYPIALYADQDSPNGLITLWPMPTKSGVLVLYIWAPFDPMDDLDTELGFPPGYERALKFGLAVELAPEFGKTLSPEVLAIANSAIGKIRRANSRPQTLDSTFHPGSWHYSTGGFFPVI